MRDRAGQFRLADSSSHRKLPQRTIDRFQGLDSALRNTLSTDCALTRISTSKNIGGGKYQKGSALYFTPDSPEAALMIGLNSMSILIVTICQLA